MIIDSHIHLGTVPKHFTDEFAQEMMSSCYKNDEKMSVNPNQLINEMNQNSISKAFVLAFNAKRTLKVEVPNEYISQLCYKYPDRFIGFGSFDGMQIANRQHLRNTMESLGLSGYKIASAYLNLSPSDKCWYPLFEDAIDNNLPVLIHMGFTPIKNASLKYCHPVHLKRALERYPELKIIIAHMAWPWVGETIKLLKEFKNVYADLSIVSAYQPIARVSEILLSIKKEGVVHKVLWGSDYPMVTMHESKSRINSLIKNMENVLTNNDWRHLLFYNANQIIN